ALWPVSVSTVWPLATSQRSAVLLSPVVSSALPSGENVARPSAPLVEASVATPPSVRSAFPVAVSQRTTTPRRKLAAPILPSDERATPLTGLSAVKVSPGLALATFHSVAVLP